MAERVFKYLKPEDIRRLDSFEFAPRVFVEGFMAGRHRSRQRGYSTEFQDYREYASGDDLKFVDWKVYARTDQYFLRTFEQETDLTCYIFLDSSASMAYGERITKLEYASFFAAGLAYLITKTRDRFSLLTFDNGLRAFFPPGSTSRHMHEVLGVLEKNKPGGETSLAATLARAFPLTRKRGTLTLISDFLDDPGAIFRALNLYLHRGFDVKMFQILDPCEMDLPSRGLASFVDMENRQRVVLHTEEMRELYAERMTEHTRQLREYAARRRIQFTSAVTDWHHYRLFERFVEA